MGHILEHLRTKIHNTHLDPSQQDRLVFTATDSGKFSSKKYGNLIQQPGIKRDWARWIWHGSLPPNIAAFLWKLLRHAVPVDSRVKSWPQDVIVVDNTRNNPLLTCSCIRI